MAVYFAYRCDEMGPSDLHRRRFDDATVIDWFRRHWVRNLAVPGHERVEAILGARVHSFVGFFRFVDTTYSRIPTTIEDVTMALSWCHLVDSRFEEHCIQMLTEGGDAAFYFFDDAFVAAHPDLTAYLLHDEPLPDGHGEPGWKPNVPESSCRTPLFRHAPGEGRVYAVPRIHAYNSLDELLTPDNVCAIDGLRLPALCRLLLVEGESKVVEWGLSVFPELADVLSREDLVEDDFERAIVQTLQAEPGDEATWRAYADWLMERGELSPGIRVLRLALPRLTGAYPTHNLLYAGDATRNVVHAGEHVAHVSIHAGGDGFNQLFLFDDLWAGAHPVLADALVRYGSRWDVLSTGNEQRIE